MSSNAIFPRNHMHPAPFTFQRELFATTITHLYSKFHKQKLDSVCELLTSNCFETGLLL
jgi:hypothetical protein